MYCRIKPLGENDEESCVKIIDDDKKVLQLNAPKVCATILLTVLQGGDQDNSCNISDKYISVIKV